MIPLFNKSDIQMSAFSDSYVISDVFPAWHVLAAVQALGANFLQEGILTRGAVAFGQAYHRERVLFGPAIIEAYRLESDVAKYPRILVTEEVRRKVWGYHVGLCRGELLKQDVDGCWFVNLLVPPISNWTALAGPPDVRDEVDYLERVRKVLRRQLKTAADDMAHQSKTWWLIRRFNRAAKRHGIEMIPQPSVEPT